MLELFTTSLGKHMTRHICTNPIDYFSWYRRSEYGTRVAFFYTSATISGAFGEHQCKSSTFLNSANMMFAGGLLAAAIHNMDGIGGKHGWQWIFLIEGLFTVVVGVASFWVIQDFPDTAKFLKPEESMFSLLLLLRV